MENLTHTIAGIAMAEAGLRELLGPGTTVVLALASSLPDVDVLTLFGGPAAGLTYRRTVTHSIFGVPILCLGAAWAFRRLYPNLRYSSLYWLCMLASAVHLLFDWVNSYGVVFLAPFSMRRYELASVFIVDPYFTGCLALPLLLSLVPTLRPRRRLLARGSLLLAGLYISFCVASRAAAERTLSARVRADGLKPEFAYVFPEPFGPLRWRGVALQDGLYRVYLIRSLSGEAEPAGEVRTQAGDPRVEAARRTELGRRLEWFFKAPVWTLDGAGVSVYDLRFRSLLLRRGEAFRFRFPGTGIPHT